MAMPRYVEEVWFYREYNERKQQRDESRISAAALLS